MRCFTPAFNLSNVFLYDSEINHSASELVFDLLRYFFKEPVSVQFPGAVMYKTYFLLDDDKIDDDEDDVEPDEEDTEVSCLYQFSVI